MKPEKYEPGREIATIRRLAGWRGNQAAGAIWAAIRGNSAGMGDEMEKGFPLMAALDGSGEESRENRNGFVDFS